MKGKPEIYFTAQNMLSAPVMRALFIRGMALLFFALIGGIAVFLFTWGIGLGVLWFAPYWRPAYTLYSRFVGLKDEGQFIPAPLPWLRVLFLLIRLYILHWFFRVGVMIFMESGFFGQNLIYMIVSS